MTDEQGNTEDLLNIANLTYQILANREEIDPGSRRMELLKTLIELTDGYLKQEVNLTDVRFTYFEVANQLKKQDNTESAGKYVRRLLNDLLSDLEFFKPHIETQLLNNKVRHRLKIKSAKDGRRTYLYLDREPLESEAAAPLPQQKGDIYYSHYSSPKPNRFSNWLADIAVTTRAKWLFFSPVLACITATAVAVFGLFVHQPTLSAAASLCLLASLLLFFAMSPILSVVEKGITIAPAWMSGAITKTSFFVYEPASPESKAKHAIRLKSFEAQCPACNGKVLIQRGKREYRDRIVGNCIYSPEHLYTFDHRTLTGKALR